MEKTRRLVDQISAYIQTHNSVVLYRNPDPITAQKLPWCEFAMTFSAIDQRKIAILVLLDLSAAFDTVDHQILLDRLHIPFGVCGVALDWFKCYLTGRRQFVSVNGMRSDPKLLKCGVPQGSVLGSLLFLAYVSPIHPWGISSENMGYTSTHLLTTPSFIWLLMLTLPTTCLMPSDLSN